VGGRGDRLELGPGTRLAADLPETSPERRRSAEFDEGTAAWRDGLAGSLPQAPLLHDLAASALQDVWILGDDLLAPVGGWSAAWRDGLAAPRPQAPLLHALAASALQDVWILGDDLLAPVAGWSPSWRYLWPRDAAFCAVALARVGHLGRAVEALAHLQSLQAS